MATLKKVIKVTKAQYNILSSGGRVGDYVGLNDDYIYLIEDNTEYVDVTTVDFPDVATYLDWDTTYTLGAVAGQHIRVTMPEAPVYSWSDIPDAPSTFPPSAHNHSTSDITSGVFDIARIPNIPLTKITGVSTIGTTAASTTPIVTTVSSSSTDAQIPTARAVYGALSLAPGIATVSSSGSGQFVNSIAYNANTHELSYGLIGGSSNPLSSSIYVGHGDLTFINTVGRGGFRSTSTTATNAGYPHNGQFNWSNFGGVTNSWGFQITALDIPNDRYNQLRVWQNGLVYNTYKNSTGATTDIFSISPAGAITVTGDISYRGTKATYPMIKWVDNTSDTYGNGVSIGGGGLVVVGAGESSDTIVSNAGVNGGSETLYLGGDNAVYVLTNLQDGWANRKTFTFNTNGTFDAPAITVNGTAVSLNGHTHSQYLTSQSNDFGKIKVGSTTTTASSIQDTITFAAGGDASASIDGKTITFAYTHPTTTAVTAGLYRVGNDAKGHVVLGDSFSLGTAAPKNYTTSVTQNSNDLVTSGAVWTAIDNLPEPMVFKGTLGTGGTITSLPTAAASNEGYTYKVITAGTYASQAAKVGDVFVSNGSAWVLIPSGDTDSDTWRAIKVNGTQLLGSGISTGAVNFKNGSNITITGSGNDVTIAGPTAITQLTGWSTIGTTAASTTPIVTTVDSDSTNTQIPTALAVYEALALAPGISTVTTTGSGNGVTAVGYDGNSHTLTVTKGSTFSLSGHTHTAADVGALPTGTTLDNIADGNTRKLSNYLLRTGGTLTGMLQVNAPIFGYNYTNGNNRPAFVFDKNGSNYTGIGSHNTADTIWFGAATLADNQATWVDSYKQKWNFNGTILEDGTSLATKYAAKSHTHTAAEANALPADTSYLASISKNSNTYTITNSAGDTTTWTIPTTLPASDVYSWAKEANKPSYTLDEVADGSTRKLSNYLPKTSYEWNKEISFGSSGYLKIGSFPMYDTNIAIEIDATTNTTYHGIVVIATQNTTATSIGSAHVVSVYGDASNTITSSIRVVWTSGSRNYNVYFVPSPWSKNLIHIRAIGLQATPSDICITQTGTAPTSTSGLEAVNVLTSKFLGISATAADSSKLNGQSASYYLNYNNLTNTPTIPTVNNASLTIQRNGTTVKTFTANASTNVTCNITVPTVITDVGGWSTIGTTAASTVAITTSIAANSQIPTAAAVKTYVDNHSVNATAELISGDKYRLVFA